MTDNFIRTIDHLAEFEEFLEAHKSEMCAISGNLHFIVGHARSATSISAIIADEYEENFVFYEDNPPTSWGIENYAGWYKLVMDEGLKSKQYVKSHIEDFPTDPKFNGIQLYAQMINLGKTLYSKYSFGPHGDYYWDIILKNFPILHNYFSDSRYLLTYRPPEKAILSMRLFFNDFAKQNKTLSEIVHAYHSTLTLLYDIAKSFPHVYFLNDVEMSEYETKQLLSRFIGKGGEPLDKYTAANKRTYDDVELIHELINMEMYQSSVELYNKLEQLRLKGAVNA